MSCVKAHQAYCRRTIFAAILEPFSVDQPRTFVSIPGNRIIWLNISPLHKARFSCYASKMIDSHITMLSCAYLSTQCVLREHRCEECLEFTVMCPSISAHGLSEFLIAVLDYDLSLFVVFVGA